MHKLTFVTLVAVCVANISPALAAFTNNSKSPTTVTTILDGGVDGVHSATSTFRLNKLDSSGRMITSDVDPDFDLTTALNDPDSFSTVYSGPSQFRVYLVSTEGTSQNPDFDITFGRKVIGVVATNSLGMGPQDPLLPNLVADFYAATTVSGNLDTQVDEKAMLEILPVNPSNPDSLTIQGNRVFGNVGTFRPNQELFYVLTVVPEPTTFAVWGLCGLGLVVAGRRRLRRLAV